MKNQIIFHCIFWYLNPEATFQRSMYMSDFKKDGLQKSGQN